MMINRTIVIAEAGVNHNGDLALAKQLVDIAANSGADYVKFQTFKAEKISDASAPKAAYQIKTTGSGESQYEMLKRLELSESEHQELIAYCSGKNIQFLSTAFDLSSIDLLAGLGIQLWKIPSGEITNLPYLKKIGARNEEVILSTGMANMTEVKAAIDVIVTSGTKRENIIVLHCHTDYPSRYDDMNLRAMVSMQNELGLKVGLSDHSAGIETSIAAVAMGACVIEKHFTINRDLPGPDHKASLEPLELAQMIQSIRNIERAMGSGIKQPTAAEEKNILVARKSIFYKQAFSAGSELTEADFEMKRPGTGVSPMQLYDYTGRKLTRSVKAGQMLSENDFK